MISDKFTFKLFKSWGILVFTFLVVFRVVLWLSMEWPDCKGTPVEQADMVVKIHNLPVRLMVYWPDSGRYWRTWQEIYQLFLLHFRDKASGLEYFLAAVFFSIARAIKDHIASGVLAQNILSLVTSWILYLMLKVRREGFAAIVIFISFTNLFAISMEYALLREILARFFLVLSIYLVWRVCITPNWGSVGLSCIVLFFLGWTRQELMLLYLLVIPLFFRKRLVKYNVVFLIVGLLGIYSHLYFVNQGSGLYLQLQQNLITESYNYNSPSLRDLPKRIYNKAKVCESIFKINCQLPSIRFHVFVLERDKIIQKWQDKNKNNSITRNEPNKMLFHDILKYNTKYIFYSSVYSLWSYLTAHLFTISPFVYSGDNSQYKFGWPSYASTSVTVYGDPLSEISHRERGPRWLLAIMSPFSESWYRKICAPFFFIGLYFITLMFFCKQTKLSFEEKTFWFLASIMSIAVLIIFCFVGVRTSRFVFITDPFMIAISLLGMHMLWQRCIDPLYLLIKKYSTIDKEALIRSSDEDT